MLLNSWPIVAQTKLRLQRRLLTSMLGLGITGMLGSAGTFALFTASSTNSGTFTAGSLMMTDTTSFTSAVTTLNNGPNRSGTDPRSGTDCATAAQAQQCATLIKSVNVAGAGMEPGQYLQGQITIKNAGTLPATMALQIQNVKTNNGNNSLYASGATGFQSCAGDVAGVASPGSSGAQLTAGATVAGFGGGTVPITGCLDVGTALRITIQDAGSGGTGPQCLFGNDTGGTLGASATNGNNHLQAPISGGLSTGGAGLSTYVATGTKLGTGSGACDDFSQAGVLGTPASPVTPGSNPKDTFGVQSAAAAGSFAALSGTSTLIFVPGAGSTTSLTNSASLGGNLTALPQWAANESHTFTVTLAFPDTGSTLLVDHNNDAYRVSNDNPYQGGAASFDLYWFAAQ